MVIDSFRTVHRWARKTLGGGVEDQGWANRVLTFSHSCAYVCTLEEQGHNTPLRGTDRYTVTSTYVCSRRASSGS